MFLLTLFFVGALSPATTGDASMGDSTDSDGEVKSSFSAMLPRSLIRGSIPKVGVPWEEQRPEGGEDPLACCCCNRCCSRTFLSCSGCGMDRESVLAPLCADPGGSESVE